MEKQDLDAQWLWANDNEVGEDSVVVEWWFVIIEVSTSIWFALDILLTLVSHSIQTSYENQGE